MKGMKNIKKVSVVLGACLIGAMFALSGCTSTIDINGEKINTEDLPKYLETAKQSAYVDGVKSVDITRDNADAVKDALVEPVAQIEQLQRDIQVLKDAEEAQKEIDAETAAKEAEEAAKVEAEATEELSGYIIDEKLYEEAIAKDITDAQLEKLQDSEIEFLDDNYDVEEKITFNGQVVVSGDSGEIEMELAPYLTFAEGDITYEYIFNDVLDTTLVTNDDPLEISFLGKDLTITNIVDDTSITVLDGQEDVLVQGEAKTFKINGETYTVTLTYVNEDRVAIDVNGVEESIDLSETEDFGDVQVRVDDIYYNNKLTSTLKDKAEIHIGSDIERTIEVGDEFIEDNEEWVFTTVDNAGMPSFGISYNVERTSIDEDEDYLALGIGEAISLPNDFSEISFDGITSENKITYDFKEKNTTTDGFYIKVTSNDVEGIVDGTNEYSEARIYTGSHIQVEIDDVWTNVTSGFVTLGDSDVKLDKDLIIDDTINPVVDINLLPDQEENLLTVYGLEIESPENWYDDGTLTITVPEKQIEVALKIK